MSANGTVTQEFLSRCEELVKRYDSQQAALLPLLRLCQERDGYVTPEAEQWIGEFLGVPVVHVHEVVTFYTLYHQRPVGKHVIDVCRNISCVLRGGEAVMAKLEQHLGIKDGETTPDGLYTLRGVECLCACEVAPMMQVNSRNVGNLTPQNVVEALPKS